MKHALLRTSALIAFVWLLPLAASAQKVSVDYDKDVDFSALSSYSWQPGQPAPNSLIDKRIIAAIDRQLTAKGWTKVESAPGAIVIYQAGIDVRRQLNGWSNGPRWGAMGTVSVEEIRTGQLAVDIYDAATRQLVWRGLASDTISDKPEKNEKRMNEAVEKMFKQFPPAHGSTK
jgi:Domain of unknown function (DUF4136)